MHDRPREMTMTPETRQARAGYRSRRPAGPTGCGSSGRDRVLQPRQPVQEDGEASASKVCPDYCSLGRHLTGVYIAWHKGSAAAATEVWSVEPR